MFVSPLPIPPWGWQQCLGTHFNVGPEPSRMWRSVCVCVCVHEHGHVLLFFFFLLFLILCLGWLFYLSKNLDRLWDFFFSSAWLSAALPLSLCFSLALSLPLTLCLLWLPANRFHMFLQLTSVLNYFTCDLRYFLRKSVRYLLKDNKINLPCCPFTFLSVVLSLFPFSVPLYCVPHTVVLLSVADLVLLIILMCFAFFDQETISFHS